MDTKFQIMNFLLLIVAEDSGLYLQGAHTEITVNFESTLNVSVGQ